MSAFTATTRSAVIFISGSCRRRRLAASFSRRSQEILALTTPASPPPLPLIRHSLGFPIVRKGRGRGRGGGVWAEEDMGESHDLEAEIYEFMEKSANPVEFPRKEDLIAAGREDLARAIAKEGGWLAYGWHLDEEDEGAIRRVAYLDGKAPCEEDSRIYQRRMVSVAGEADASLNDDSNNFPASSEDSSRASLSGSVIMDAEASGDAGIEGILSRLEKERNLAFGLFSLKEKRGGVEKENSHSRRAGGRDLDVEVGSIESTGRFISSHVGEGSHHHSRALDSHHQPPMDVNYTDSDPGMWRAWRILRSGDPLCNFEAAEIISEEDQSKSCLKSESHQLIKNGIENISDVQKVNEKSSRSNCPYDTDQGILKNEICVQLQNLESQLTSALFLLRSRTSVSSYKRQDKESLLKNLHKLSDVLEFQQNDIKNARDKLRSTRAKLAVMEGKIALEIIESQKVIEVKQRRFDAAERALLILRPVSIVWPKSASNVLLSGSFDGWTSQRRMERCKSGVFSLNLKLYHGRYEIKFIVDGVWTVNPLRPIIKNNGFENNLFIVT